MSDVAIISALSPMVTTAFMGVLYWGWRKFTRRLDENRDIVTAAVNDVKTDVDKLATKVVDHMNEDAALFNAHAQRISRNEGALEVLTAIAAAQKKEPS